MCALHCFQRHLLNGLSFYEFVGTVSDNAHNRNQIVNWSQRPDSKCMSTCLHMFVSCQQDYGIHILQSFNVAFKNTSKVIRITHKYLNCVTILSLSKNIQIWTNGCFKLTIVLPAPAFSVLKTALLAGKWGFFSKVPHRDFFRSIHFPLQYSYIHVLSDFC